MISLVILILSSSALLLYLSLEETCDEVSPFSIAKDTTYPCRGAFVRMSRAIPNADHM